MYRSRQLSRRLQRDRALDVHFDLGLACYDAGDAYGVARHRTAVGMLPEGGVDSLEFLALDWRARWLEDDHEGALVAARRIVDAHPEDADGLLELSHILSDMQRPEEALEVLAEGVQRCSDDADLWYELGIVAEVLERWELRLKAFHTVWQLEHLREPTRRLWLSEDRFVAVVEETLERLPPVALKALGNVAILVEDYPEEWVVQGDIADPRILGLFDGPDRASENSVEAVSEGPARVYIYKWNIERSCGSVEEAEEQVAITVLHEIGHYLGLDEDALHFRGLG